MLILLACIPHYLFHHTKTLSIGLKHKEFADQPIDLCQNTIGAGEVAALKKQTEEVSPSFELTQSNGKLLEA